MTRRDELLEALEAWMRKDLQPQLQGVLAYENRVAANLVALLRREEEIGPRLQALDAAFAREQGFAEHGPETIARALRDGALQDGEALRCYLRQRCLLQTAMDNPRYEGLEEGRERWGDIANDA